MVVLHAEPSALGLHRADDVMRREKVYFPVEDTGGRIGGVQTLDDGILSEKAAGKQQSGDGEDESLHTMLIS
jgi:hypothetical protein